jgi:4-hydroxythreonine-4-phosphate dehydrogenase
MKTEQNFFTQPRPRLAVTMGDPAGIGPEVVLKALADPEVCQNCQITVIGSQKQLEKTAQSAKIAVDLSGLSILDVGLDAEIEAGIITGVGNAAGGAASFAYMETAIAATLNGQFDAIVTAPIAKSAWRAAGYNYPGQTELLAQTAGAGRYGMLFVARSPYTGFTLRTLLATTHIPLRQVADAIAPALLTQKLDLLVECLQQDFGISQPKIAIAGLNPHSGEQGQLGTEEIDWLIPWLETERQKRPQIILDGPVPPDTLWVKPGQAWFGMNNSNGVTAPNQADAYLALYHDQGLIPVKLMAFDRAVNTTIGLPFIRTSPDHGTAFDIAGRGVADPTSMKAALELAVELVKHKTTRTLTQLT